MSGVCPKCVDFFEDEHQCPSCGSPLISPQEWKRQRDLHLQEPKPEPVHSSSQSTAMTVESKKEFILGFFLGALLFFFAFLSIMLIYGDKFNL